MKSFKHCWPVILLALPYAAHAATSSSRIFGVELEFTNKEIENADYAEYKGGPSLYPAADENVDWRDKWAKLMKKRCKDLETCKVKEVEGWFVWEGYDTYDVKEYVIKYENGFEFTISLDPHVVEIKIGPYTRAEYAKFKTLIDSEIYGTAKELGLKVPKDAACHVTFGAKGAFGGKIKAYRNYLAANANHPEADLVMNPSVENSPPLSYLPESSRKNFTKVIGEVDSGKIRDEVALADAMYKRVQNKTYDESMVNEDYEEADLAQKYQAKNNSNMKKKDPLKRRLENRAMPGAQNGEDVIDLIALNDADIDFAISQRGNIEVNIPGDLSKDEIVTRFMAWAKERKLDTKKYARFFDPGFQAAAKKKGLICGKLLAAKKKSGR